MADYIPPPGNAVVINTSSDNNSVPLITAPPVTFDFVQQTSTKKDNFFLVM